MKSIMTYRGNSMKHTFGRTRFLELSILALILLGVTLPVFTDTLTVPNDFTSGTTISSADMNDNFTAIEDLVNGNITDSNIKTGANIAQSKIAGSPFASLPVSVSDLTSGTNNNGISFRGNYGSGSIPETGAGTRLMWYPEVTNNGAL